MKTRVVNNKISLETSQKHFLKTNTEIIVEQRRVLVIRKTSRSCSTFMFPVFIPSATEQSIVRYAPGGLPRSRCTQFR